MSPSQEFCFCTLAVGDRYRTHAHILAQDIQQHSPTVTLYVLTDRPESFQEFPHVLAFKHILQSVKGYHDKRFVLEKALSLSESCMFLDSDVRITGAVTEKMGWQPGITARAGCDLLNRMKNIRDSREIQIIKAVAQKLNIDLQQVQWLHEFMFAMRRQAGLEQEFFQLWQTISYWFELQGLYHGEGYAMGLAAAKAGLRVGFEHEDRFPFFKDNIERVRIKKGQSTLQKTQIYFDAHQAIEYPHRSTWEKLTNRCVKKALFYYRLSRLRRVAHQDADYVRLLSSNSQ
jgi:hypothetical protein